MFICIRDQSELHDSRERKEGRQSKREREREAHHATRIEHILKTAQRLLLITSCHVLSRGTKERNYDVRIEVFQPEAVAVPLLSLPPLPAPHLHLPPALAALLARLLCVIICFGLMEDKHFMAASRSHGLALTLHRTVLRSTPPSLSLSPLPSLRPVPLPPAPASFSLIQLHFCAQSALKGPHKASKISANEQPALLTPHSLLSLTLWPSLSLTLTLCCPSLETAPVGIGNSARPNR